MDEYSLPHQTESNILSREGTQSVVYEFKAGDGKMYVRKIMNSNQLYPNQTFEQSAENKSIIYKVMKEYLPNIIVDTKYVVIKDQEGEEHLEIIQPKILGKRWDKAEVAGEITQELLNKRRDIMNVIKKVSEDPRLENVREAYRISEAYSIDENIIVGDDNNLHVIDW